MGVGAWWLRTPEGNAWLGEQVSSRVTATMGEGALEIGGVQTNVFDRVVLKDVVLTDGSGRRVIGAPRATLEMGWSGILAGSVAVERVVLVDPTVDLVVDQDGALDLNRMFPSENDDSPPSDLPVRIEVWDARIDGGSFSYDPGGGGQIWAAEELSLQGSARGQDTTWTVPDLSGAGLLSAPDAGPFIITGGLRYDLNGYLDLTQTRLEVAGADLRVAGNMRSLTTKPVLSLSVMLQGDLDALEPLTGDLGLKGELRVLAQIDGPLDAMAVEGRLEQAEGGGAKIDAVLDILDPEIGYEGSLDAESLDLQELLDAVTEATVLTGKANFSGTGLAYPDGIDATGEITLTDSVGWGYPLPLVSTGFSFKEGQIRASDVIYEAWWGRVTGRGRIGESDLDVDILAKVWDASGLQDFGADGLKGAVTLPASVQADWSVSDNVTTDLNGTLIGEGLGYQDYGVIGSYEGPIAVSVDASGTQVFGPDALLTGVDASGVLLGAAEGDWEAYVDRQGGVAFKAELDGAMLRSWELHADSVSIVAEGQVSAEGVPQIYADLQLGQPGLERFSSDTGSAVVVLDADDVSMDLQCRSGGVNQCAITGGGNLQTGSFAFPAFELGSADGVRWENPKPVVFELTPNYSGATDMDIHLSSVAGSLDVMGDLDLEGALDSHLSVDGLALSWIGALFPKEVGPLAGSASGWAVLKGSASAPELDGHLELVSLFVPGQVWGLNLAADLKSVDQGLSVLAQVANQADQVFVLRGTVPADLNVESPGLRPHQAVDLQLLVQETSFAELSNLFPFLGPLPGGYLSGEADVTGSLRAPNLNMSLGTRLAVGTPAKWVRLDADLGMDDSGLLRLKGGGHEREDRLLDMGGRAKLDLAAFTAWMFEEGPEPNFSEPEQWLSQVNISLVPLRVHTDVIRVFTELPEGLDGRLTGAIALFGNLHTPQVSGALQLTEAQVGGLALEPAVVSLGPEEDGYALSGLFGFRESVDVVHSFVISGFVPFSLGTASDWSLDDQLAREGLDVEIGGDGLPLAVLSLVDPGILDTYGVLDVEGTITGSVAAPNPIVDLDIQDGGFSYPEINTRFRAIRMHAEARQDHLDLAQLQFESFGLGRRQPVTNRKNKEEGWLPKFAEDESLACVDREKLTKGVTRVSGFAQLDGLELGELDFRACANNAVLSSTAEQLIKATMDLSLTGPWPKVRVRGDVLSNEVNMVFGKDFFFDSKGLVLDPRIQLVREEQQLAALIEEGQPFYYPWDIQVDVDLNRSMRLDITVPLFDGYDEALKLSELRLKNAVMDGQITYLQREDFYDAKGNVNIVRGSLELINKAFNLDEGELQFGGSEIENPTINFQASRIEGTYGTIGVGVTGNVENPELTFTSSEGYSNTDILTILLLGIPSSKIGGNGGDTALALATAQLTGALTEQLESGAQFNLVDSVQLNNSTGQGFDLVVGKSVGNKGYLELEYNSAPEEDENGLDATFDFVITRRLTFQLGYDEELSSDLFFTYRF